MQELLSGYCIDTSALIDLWRRKYPIDVFPSVWKKIEGLVSQGRLVCPRQVFKELEERDDELLKWAKDHKPMFIPEDQEQQKMVAQILEQFPGLVDPDKTKEADPFVIALAKSKNWKLITSESFSGGLRPKIPNVCSSMNIGWVSLLEFFREENWKI